MLNRILKYRQCIVQGNKDVTKTFNYTTITDKFKEVSWSDISHEPMWLTLELRDQPSYFLQQSCNQKDKHLKLYE